MDSVAGLVTPLCLFCAQLMLLYTCLFRCSSAMYYGRELGVLRPNDPYMFVGEDLKLDCNLTTLDLLEDSSYLYFTRNGMEVQREFVTILNTRSVRLNFPINQPSDEGHFVCWLRQKQGNPRTIGSQHVSADYRPAKVKEVNCTVYNWETMTCRWDLGRQYRHPENMRVSLVWTISDEQKDCPEGHMTDTSCTWVTGEQDGFLAGHVYIMSVVVTNKKRQVSSQSHLFRINTSSIVKPAPVVGLTMDERNDTCLKLVFDHSEKVHDKVAIVEYFSQWNPSHWHKLKKIHFKRGPNEPVICGLMPFTEYTIRVAIKPLPRNNADGYRSDWSYLERVRTDPSFPEAAPEMCTGCFSERPCGLDHCRNILVYWRHIPWSQRRSVIHMYLLQYNALRSDKGQKGNVTTLYPNNSLLLSLDNDTDYALSLFAITSEKKLSKNYSSLLVPSKANKPIGPSSLVVEAEHDIAGSWTGQFILRWSGDGHPTSSYIVAWCRGNTDTHVCDHEEKNRMEWKEIPGDSTHYKAQVVSEDQHGAQARDYLVGVARQAHGQDGHIISSGITWGSCYFHQQKPRVPQNVDFSKVVREGTLRVILDYVMCERTDTDVYISRFILYYCIIAGTSNNGCQGSEYNMTVRRDARSVLLENLVQGAYYKVSMVADSHWGASQRSEPVISRVLATPHKGESSDFSIIGVVLGIFVIIILFLIAVCKIKRRFQKHEEKFKDNVLPSPPESIPTQKNPQNRPLPLLPEAGSTTASGTASTSDLGSSVGTDKRLRGGKHKSITSETSLLGYDQEAGHDDDSRRRHKSTNGSVSERSKLLPEEGGTTHCGSNKYDSDSGAGSSEDHDYASVEGSSGSAEESGTGTVRPNTQIPPVTAKGTTTPGKSRAGYVSEDKALGQDITDKQMQLKLGDHKPAPNYAPPPPPALPQSGYSQAALVPVPTSGTLTSFKPVSENQLPLKMFDSSQRSNVVQPAQLVVAMEPMPPSGGGYVGSEDPTLLRRPPSTRLKQQQPSMQDTPFMSGVDPYASANVAAPFPTQPPPSPAPPVFNSRVPEVSKVPWVSTVSRANAVANNTLPPARPAVARGYVPHSTAVPASTSCRSDVDSEEKGSECELSSDSSEPIYSPPWESWDASAFKHLSIDNRPLSEYMLKLPNKFFDSTQDVNGAPTTEL